MTINNDIHFWFSHRINKYNIVQIGGSKKIQWTEEKIVMDWDNCALNVIGKIADGKTRIVLRSESNRNSHYMGDKPIQLRFMMGIDISSISKIYYEPYVITQLRNNLQQSERSKNIRAVFRLDNDYWIWEWKRGDGRKDGILQEGKEADSVPNNIERIHKQISDSLLSPTPAGDLFNISFEEKVVNTEILKVNKVIPVIYQPSIDSLENFVREVHCNCIDPDMIEVSLLFENEQLRRHRHVNRVYEKIRLFFYGRKIDVESFKIKAHLDDLNDNQKFFVFTNIYSYDYNILEDTIHGNPHPPEIKVKYFFSSYLFPIVFINTSNHAMAEHDNNNKLWKWEYVPFLKNAPVIFGTKSRQEIDSEFTPFFRKLIRVLVG